MYLFPVLWWLAPWTNPPQNLILKSGQTLSIAKGYSIKGRIVRFELSDGYFFSLACTAIDFEATIRPPKRPPKRLKRPSHKRHLIDWTHPAFRDKTHYRGEIIIKTKDLPGSKQKKAAQPPPSGGRDPFEPPLNKGSAPRDKRRGEEPAKKPPTGERRPAG